MTPSKEQAEAAKKIIELFDHDNVSFPEDGLAIAQFLAARDAEILKPWRQGVAIALSLLERGKPGWGASKDILNSLLSPAISTKLCPSCQHPVHELLCWEIKNSQGVATCPCSSYPAPSESKPVVP